MFADSSCNQKYPEIFGIFLKTKNYQDINNATYDKLREKLIWDPLVDVQLIKAKFFYKWCFSYKPDLFYTISWAFSENFYFKMRKVVHYDLFSQSFIKNYGRYFLINCADHGIQSRILIFFFMFNF